MDHDYAHRQPSSAKPKPPASQPTSSSNANAPQAAETHATATRRDGARPHGGAISYAAAHAPSLIDFGIALRADLPAHAK
jgi:hypothetical protein